MSGKTEVDVEFSQFDALERYEASKLISELQEHGVDAHIEAEHPAGRGMLEVAGLVALIAVSTASAAGLAVVASFLYRVFRKGVILDLSGARPKVRKNDDLPKGTLLVLHGDGTSELHRDVDSGTVGDLMKDAISMHG